MKEKVKSKIIKTIKEKELIEGIKSGNEIILKWFYLRNFPLIKSYILQHGGSIEDTEDIFQDALLVLYTKLHDTNFALNASISTFFYAICKNIWLRYTYNKKKWIRTDLLVNDYQDEELSITDILLQEDRQNLFNTYFLSLPELVKQLWQDIFDHKSYNEMALRLGYTEGYLRKKKCETKKLLIDRISKDSLFPELVEI